LQVFRHLRVCALVEHKVTTCLDKATICFRIFMLCDAATFWTACGKRYAVRRRFALCLEKAVPPGGCHRTPNFSGSFPLGGAQGYYGFAPLALGNAYGFQLPVLGAVGAMSEHCTNEFSNYRILTPPLRAFRVSHGDFFRPANYPLLTPRFGSTSDHRILDSESSFDGVENR
jgi:hypothetical protein